MNAITVFARMMFSAPLTGMRVFFTSAVWLLPIVVAVDYARESAETGAFAEVNATIASTANAILEGKGPDLKVPAWFDPVAWIPLMGALALWLFMTQRAAMRRVGIARPSGGPAAFVRNMLEWMVLALFLPVLGLTLLFGGAVLGASVEFGEPYSIYSPPVLADIFAAPVTEFGHALWSEYRFEPLLIVLIGSLVFLMAGRFMALHAAFAAGDDMRGKPARLSILACILFTTFVHFFTALLVVWTLSTLGGFEIAMWGFMAVHFGLIWCSMSASAGHAAMPEIERSLLKKAVVEDGFNNASGGAMPDSKPGYDAGDDLVAALKAWEQSRAA